MRTRRLLKTVLGRRILGRRRSGRTSVLSTPAIHGAILHGVESAAPQGLTGEHLDVGSGAGELIKLITTRYAMQSFACDYTDRLMKLPGQPVEIVDLNHQRLPYAENRFTLVTCGETIEHLENYRAVIREIYRVLRPGGIVAISTPNVLNLRSRLRYFTFGFPNLFGPLAVGKRDVHSPGGHINPVGWFYLAHALLEAGFTDLQLRVDHYQRRSLVSFVLLFLPIRLVAAYAYHRELRKYHTIDGQNDWALGMINSPDMMLGRTLVVTARKSG